MSKRILLIDPDKEFLSRLTSELQAMDEFVVRQATSIREACLLLAQGRFDLGFLPVTQTAQPVRTLRALQPDLRLVLTTPTTNMAIPDVFAGQVQGVLIKPLLTIDLPSVMTKALGQPLIVDSPLSVKQGVSQWQRPETAMFEETLQQARLGELVQTAVFADQDRLIAYWGEMNEPEAGTVALQVWEGWRRREKQIAQMQFMHLPARAGELLLYTRRVIDMHLLTLVALPNTPLSELRVRAEKLTKPLARTVQGQRRNGDAVLIETSDLGQRRSVAVVWRALRPLPETMQIALRRALERIAAANACVLTYIDVTLQLVHLVALSPPERDSAWVAYLFKNGSEEMIREAYKQEIRLWDTGYYAAESTDPLSAAELQLFLDDAGHASR